jgi:hypothetical protein
MRHFHGLLFLGSGLSSQEGRAHLHRILDRALDISGGLQQPDPVTEPPRADREDEDRRWQREIEDAVRDIGAALLGREIQLGEVLPYPPQAPCALCLQYGHAGADCPSREAGTYKAPWPVRDTLGNDEPDE